MIVYSTQVAYETKQIAKKSLFNFWGDKLCKHNLLSFYEEKLISISVMTDIQFKTLNLL